MFSHPLASAGKPEGHTDRLPIAPPATDCTLDCLSPRTCFPLLTSWQGDKVTQP
ncbi:hypothetical protein [Trichothermofontia sp.]